MNLTLLPVPFNQDKHRNGMGQAPQALFDAGLLERLAALGVHVEYIEEAENNLGEGELLTRLGRLQNIVCDDIYDSLKKNHLPVLLGGDCCNALGMWGGLTHARPNLKIGVVWFDAHGDWNTEETSLSGYIGGMPYATICGYGNAGLRLAAGLAKPAPTQNCALIGARDLDPPEEALMKTTQLTVLDVEGARRTHSMAAKALSNVQTFYLHLDIDVLDLKEAPGVNYPAPGGLKSDEVIRICSDLIANKRLMAVTLSAVDPTLDKAGKTVAAGVKVLEGVLGNL